EGAPDDAAAGVQLADAGGALADPPISVYSRPAVMGCCDPVVQKSRIVKERGNIPTSWRSRYHGRC
uniref:hypothetical protein n=1 Tax=Thiohalomonas denitrificans TaxID=415747 RepID=UPI0026EA1013